MRRGSVGVGEGLKVGDVFCALPGLGGHPLSGGCQLGGDIPRFCESPGAVAENAAADAQRSVPVGAGAAGGQSQLVHLAAVLPFQVGIQIVPIHLTPLWERDRG